MQEHNDSNNNKTKKNNNYSNPPYVINYISTTARIGKNVKIWHFAYVGDDTIIGDTVEDGAVIGSRAAIRPGIRIGTNSVVAMAAVVTKDVPSDVVVMGHPAKVKYSRSEYNSKQAAWNSS